MTKTAILIGNSDGIGLATTRKLLDMGWEVSGISRSDSPLQDANYKHRRAEVQKENFTAILKSTLAELDRLDLCIYCPGIGEILDLSNMEQDLEIIEVNFMGLVKTVTIVLPFMAERNEGHFIGLSSFADELVSAEAPSYHASKAGFTSYLESLALALKTKGIYVTNLRFGFVDTKMAKGEVKPFMMPVDRAVKHILTCIDKKPVRYTAPQAVIPLVKFRRWMMRLSY
jgi:short-subunit dehydrogenase